MTSAKRPAPISSHPAFKWGVGAWFALLLGLGLFVMPAEIHQLIAERLGLYTILPNALAIRVLLSAGAALIGLAIGLVLAMRVVALGDAGLTDDDEVEEASEAWPREEVVAPADALDTPRRPFNPREDLAEEGIEPFDLADTSGEVQGEGEEISEAQFEEIVAEADGIEVFAASSPEPFEEEEREPAPQLTEHEAPQAEAATPPSLQAALGDLSLEELTLRLGAALAAHKAAPPTASGEDTQPVIAFLRREAERETVSPASGAHSGNPQAELRSALDKLSRVGRPK